ncbi:hypothetical protein JCM3263A_29860 [Thermobifida fusca]|jgi:hypothetical protein|uniref:Uncharacterized protein n=2 Tax=Thermobifida fusca TaxID=2021 RepID=A0A9P2TBA5_THEFU|nr:MULTISPECIES: hypothetical protein [Thermobifida]AAZ55885.1 hypothetical protein Tfu_1852 [Thermobifida fusca YX]EOR71106.1 hypothetical protein TM51_09536 [Thermobifida fusca TM51]MBO2530757.1 hypothetical protein [Thermobifida sp.]MDD6791226.1 hypothetical protein [Thermobifida fusca]PPS93521.1 hypothetical protein BH05_07545 [Thermobifida fusca]
MSPLILLGIGALAGFVVFVILFILALTLGEVPESAVHPADYADDEAIEQTLRAHGVRFC